MSDRILLVNPMVEFGSDLPIYNRIWPPLSLANCAAILEENGFEVGIIDANADNVNKPPVNKLVACIY